VRLLASAAGEAPLFTGAVVRARARIIGDAEADKVVYVADLDAPTAGHDAKPAVGSELDARCCHEPRSAADEGQTFVIKYDHVSRGRHREIAALLVDREDNWTKH
jgi:hypothetical protein